MGVATGCGFKEIYGFPHTTYPYSSCICTFCSSIPSFLFIFLMFFVLLLIIVMRAEGYCSCPECVYVCVSVCS